MSDTHKIYIAQTDETKDTYASRSNRSKTVVHPLPDMDAVNTRLAELRERGFSVNEVGYPAVWQGRDVYVCFVATQDGESL